VLGDIMPTVEAAERRLRWEVARRPDYALPRHRHDPKLAPCPGCSGHAAVFVRSEIAGRTLEVTVGVYVKCPACGAQTVPCGSKRLAAAIWARKGKGVYVSG
jgi:hypothetical protein